MTVHTERLTLLSEGGFHAHNVTEAVRAAIRASGIRAGTALVYYMHTTGAVLIIEHEAGILVDLEEVLEKIVPAAYEYKHHLRGYDINGNSHIRAALLGLSAVVPVVDGDLLIGTWQEIIVVDMDTEAKSDEEGSAPRPRTVLIQVQGE